jgi:2'-5' RNA ligase
MASLLSRAGMTTLTTSQSPPPPPPPPPPLAQRLSGTPFQFDKDAFNEDAHQDDFIGLFVALIDGDATCDPDKLRNVQRIREQHDAAYSRWVPHITLIPPFSISRKRRSQHQGEEEEEEHRAGQPPEEAEQGDEGEQQQQEEERPGIRDLLDQLSDVLRDVAGRHERMELALDEIGRFPLRQYTNIHLRPSRGASASASFHELLAMQTDLHESMPWRHLSERGGPRRSKPKSKPKRGGHPRRRRYQQRFEPHLSLAQTTSVDATERIEADITSTIIDGGSERGLRVSLGRVHLLAKPARQSGPYGVWAVQDLAERGHSSNGLISDMTRTDAVPRSS